MNIKNPTLRKIRNAGLTPVRYRDESSVRHGWVVREETGATVLRLIGDERNTVVRGPDRKHIEEITRGGTVAQQLAEFG